MVRIKTTSKKSGEVFTSPFVFTMEQAEKKVEKLERWLKKEKFEIVPAGKHHQSTEYKEAHRVFDPLLTDSLEILRLIENTWI